MNPFRLAVVCFMYEIMNFLVSRVLYILTPEIWVYNRLSGLLKNMGHYVWDDIYMGVFLVWSLFVNCILIMLTAKSACRFINIRSSRCAKIYHVKPLGLILIWHAFAFMEIILVSLVYAYMSELDFYKQLSVDMNESIREVFGEYNSVPLAFPLSLPIAVALLWIISAFLQRFYSYFNNSNVPTPNYD